MSLSNTLRNYVRRHDLGIAKQAYRSLVAPVYRAASIPLYDITSSAKFGYTWFRIPKNGTHSIMEVLQTHAPPEVNSSDVPYFTKKHRDRFKFCILRNPWDRLVSVYCNKVLMKLMFEECWDKDFTYFIDFVRRQDLRRCDPHIRLQTAMFPVEEMDYVGRMEGFEEDVAHILRDVLKIDAGVPHAGAIEHDDYREYYTSRTVSQAEEMYRDDIVFGNYSYAESI